MAGGEGSRQRAGRGPGGDDDEDAIRRAPAVAVAGSSGRTSLAEGGATTAKYVVIGAPLPDEFWLGFDGASGHVGVDRRPYTAPNISQGLETLTRVPGTYVVAGPQLGVPGVPGTVSVAITLPTPIPSLS